eukprot:m.70445 g.70445  ORF g.70445 m.70445 type:complete len:456 (+) comp24228_c1_seq1:116-1483(+)
MSLATQLRHLARATVRGEGLLLGKGKRHGVSTVNICCSSRSDQSQRFAHSKFTSPIVLGIETSFDDTAVAIVSACGTVLADTRVNQLSIHAEHGGVVPTAAGQFHNEHLPQVVENALKESKKNFGVSLEHVDALACTLGPGLSPCLQAGLNYTKTLAQETGLPVFPIHHMEAHALTARLAHDIPFPHLVCLATGGHFYLLIADGVGEFRCLGKTYDDAPGEAFDKIARALGVCGGKELEKIAEKGDPTRFEFPRPLLQEKTCNVTFSGLKSSGLNKIQVECGRLTGNPDDLDLTKWKVTADLLNRAENEQLQADIAASFQFAVCDHIVTRTHRAILFGGRKHLNAVVLSGGVACNNSLKKQMGRLANRYRLPFHVPPPSLCLDNAVMIAWTAVEHARAGMSLQTPSEFSTFQYVPSWPLGKDVREQVVVAEIKLPKTKSTRKLKILREHYTKTIS